MRGLARRHAIAALAAAATVALAASGCGDDDDTTTTASQTTTTAEKQRFVELDGGKIKIPEQNVGSVDLSKLPVGTDLLSDSAQRGSFYLCEGSPEGGGGASEMGPWFSGDGKTYDLKKKAFVPGEVEWPQAEVSIKVKGDTRTITSNGLPKSHPTGTFPVPADSKAALYDPNPNTIAEQDVTRELSASPKVADEPSCAGGEVGITLEGVAIFNPVDALNRDAVAWETQDRCFGHPQEAGVYHYHSLSHCVQDSGTGHSDLEGYAFDGFGIYGVRGEDGEVLTNKDLDECHGHTHEIKWDGKRERMYHYHATWEFPNVVGCFRGTPIESAPTGAAIP